MEQDQQNPLQGQGDASPLVYVRAIAGAEVLEQISQSEIQAQGVEIDPEDTLYAIHDEHGRQVGVFSDRDAAFATARQHGAEPVSVH